MMHLTDSSDQKNSLFTAMSRFIGAVTNMDQTVLVPSLLRDVPLDHGCEGAEGAAAADMYSSYVLLKSIRTHMESGVRRAETVDVTETQDGVTEVQDSVAQDGGGDLQKEFDFHLRGLHSVLNKLTQDANALTRRYKDEVGRRS